MKRLFFILILVAAAATSGCTVFPVDDADGLQPRTGIIDYDEAGY